VGTTQALLLVAVLFAVACRDAPPPPQTNQPVDARRLGAWTGSGGTTLGFVSESGSFRISWAARVLEPAATGSFLLTLRSGISGRPIKVIADQRGSGSGTVEFGDDPRMYEFLVEAVGVHWTISVDETYTR